jgi:hypothetical protein
MSAETVLQLVKCGQGDCPPEFVKWCEGSLSAGQVERTADVLVSWLVRQATTGASRRLNLDGLPDLLAGVGSLIRCVGPLRAMFQVKDRTIEFQPHIPEAERLDLARLARANYDPEMDF